MTVPTALCLLAALYIALGVLFAFRGGLGFMVDLHVAMVKESSSAPRWKVSLYGKVLRLGAVLGWPLFIWRG